jgi:Lrp/AsnC family transcriptional regulator
MDEMDRKILRVLQADAALSLAELGERVGLSSTPLWRRVKALEDSGVILGRVALVNAQAVGCGLTVFVTLRTSDHSVVWLDRFAQTVSAWAEVTDIYRLSGVADYLLRVLVADMPAYDRFYKKLIALGGLTDVTSTFAMEEIKHATAVPV